MNVVSWRDDLQHIQTFVSGGGGTVEPYAQVGIVLVAFLLAWMLASRLTAGGAWAKLFGSLLDRVEDVIFAAIASVLLAVGSAISSVLFDQAWVVHIGLLIALILMFHRFVQAFVVNRGVARALRWIAMPMLILHYFGLLDPVVRVLDSMSISIGNLEVTVSGMLRVILFGSLLFWLGWISNTAGQNVIRRQEKLDLRTREVIAKLFQIGLAVVVFLLLLQVMGVNLTALAVLGGAVGVGLGFGLQSIASNFISGIIILFDRSLSVGDFVEIADGQSGYVRELNMRYTTLEAFDGKAILVPNETFITTAFTNWTHKDPKQRYRVDFSVAYKSDIRKLCDLVREAVAEHPQVISGDDVPFEERPDCEIDSFGDSGINMFVEFWMIGIDDGRNRVGGDLMLIILEALRENGYEIPFPQREVRRLED